MGIDIAGATQANSALYGNIIQGYQNQIANFGQGGQQVYDQFNNLRNQTQQTLQGLGAGQKQQLQNQYQQQLGASDQSLISRGLGNSSVVDANRQGITSGYNQSQINLQDSLTREKVGFDTQLAGQQMGAYNQNANTYAQMQGNQLGFMQGSYQQQQQLGSQQALAAQQQQYYQQNLPAQGMQNQLGQVNASNLQARNSQQASDPTSQATSGGFRQLIPSGYFAGTGGYAQGMSGNTPNPYANNGLPGYGQPNSGMQSLPDFNS